MYPMKHPMKHPISHRPPLVAELGQAINLYKTRIVQQRRIETYQKLEALQNSVAKLGELCKAYKLTYQPHFEL